MRGGRGGYEEQENMTKFSLTMRRPGTRQVERQAGIIERAENLIALDRGARE